MADKMKIAVVLESPMLEAFSLVGIDYPIRSKPDEKIHEIKNDAKMVIVEDHMRKKYEKKYPDKIIIGI